MNIDEYKSNILSQLALFNNSDLSILNPKGSSVSQWNNTDSDGIERFVNEVVNTTSRLYEDKDILMSLSPNNITDLYSIVTNLTNDLESLRNIPINEITSQHHGPLNQINNLNTWLRSTGLYTQLKLTKNIDGINKQLKEATSQLKKFDPVLFEKAINLVEELNKKKVEFEERTIKESLGTFLIRATEHKISNGKKHLRFIPGGQWMWFLLALIMGALVAGIVSSFINVLENNNNISIGAAILRVSSLAVPTYFMIFCINQFNYHKTMYEIYSFKNTSLNMMTELMKTNTDKAEFILEKGLKVLFTEPSLKDEGKYDKQLISDLIGMLNNQFNKN